MKFYKLTRKQAETIGKFQHGPNQFFDPFAGEQEDGSFVISEAIYKLLKATPQFKKVKFPLLKSSITVKKLKPKKVE